jgi:serine/threonine protein kinase
MPPEALKENLYSFSSDVWAVGVIFFEMMKGCPPWRARSEQMLYSKLLNEPIDQMLTDIPSQCREFLTKALNISVDERLTIQEVGKWVDTFREIAAG